MATEYNAQAHGTSMRSYRDPGQTGGTPSDIGPQLRTDYYQKKALIEVRKDQYFSQLANVTAMPKHYGKKIVRYHYLPLLDDANINDQGIDAAGVVMATSVTIESRLHPDAVILDGTEGQLGNRYPNNAGPVYSSGSGSYKLFSVGVDLAAAQAQALADINMATGADHIDYATAVAAVEADGGSVIEHPANSAGNLYGSSKDVGTISGKFPALSEHGGRVNRVGFKRVTLEGSLEKFGFFDEYTQESMDFDSDSELMMHVNREMVSGANEITEDALQIDLLNAAGVVRYGGIATSTDTITGEGSDVSIMSYEDFMRLSIDLDDNRCPKNTKIISGSRMVDTIVINAARVMYIGSEMIPTIKKMEDLFGNQAFVSVEHYAAAGNLLNGEIGTIDQFRIVVVPEMMHWEGAGASATEANLGYRETGGAYDVYPLLVVGDASFTTIGFQTDGKTVKFKITHKKPGTAIANRDDPYGEIGFMSIKWYYGFMILRPERIALCKSVAEM